MDPSAASGAQSLSAAQAADACALGPAAEPSGDLGEWAFVDERAEIVASVSTTDVTLDSAEESTASSPQERASEAATASSVGEEVMSAETERLVEAEEEVVDAPAAVAAEASMAIPDGCMRVRLRIGEHVRPAWCKATQIVDEFVAEFFADAMAEGKKIRLIYMGMLLIHERTMGEYGIEEDGVIHCVITDAVSTPHPQASQNLNLKGLANPTNALLVATGAGLYGLWTLLYHFPHLFSWKSIFLLSAFSAAHVSTTIARFTTA